jgi:exonuclease III
VDEPQEVRKLRFATLNIRGLQSGAEEVREVVRGHQPDVFVITETKLTRKTKGRAYQWLSELGYKQYHQAATHTQQGAAGVSILVRKTLAEWGLVNQVKLPDMLGGYMCGVQIRAPTSVPLEVIGMYAPSGQPGDKHIRAQLYKELKQRHALATSPGERYHMLVAGDFNAALMKTDRHTGKTMATDRMHRQVAHACDLTTHTHQRS